MKSQIKSRYKLMGMLAVMALLLLPFGGLMVGAQNGEAVTIDLVADDLTFDTTEITVPAGAEVAINFDNQDGSPHNFALYADAPAQEPVFVGEIVTGGQAVEYRFTAPDEPGTYFFRCDVHPSTMTGDFIVTGATGTPAPDGTATAAPANPCSTGTAQPRSSPGVRVVPGLGSAIL
jgi:plastocyanin